MSDLRDLYQQVILEHKKHPRNFGKLPGYTHRAVGDNPLCGDHVEVELISGDQSIIEDVRFTGDGCAICTASASLMSDHVKGKNTSEIATMAKEFQEMVTEEDPDAPTPEILGKLRVLAGVREFPARVKCASLPWHTLKAALEQKRTVTTE